MPKIIVNKGNTRASHDMLFCFPPNWIVLQYDDQKSFYRQQFERIADSKAVDIVAINPDRNFHHFFCFEISHIHRQIASQAGSRARVESACICVRIKTLTSSIRRDNIGRCWLHLCNGAYKHLRQPIRFFHDVNNMSGTVGHSPKR